MLNNSLKLTVLVGKGVPLPLSAEILETLDYVEVIQDRESLSVFQLVFKAGRSGFKTGTALDYAALIAPLFRPFNRVILVATMGLIPTVIMDGVITRQELVPGLAPGESQLTVIGEDLSAMMNIFEKTMEYPGMNDAMIVETILAEYAEFGIIPQVAPPLLAELPDPLEYVPIQRGTDQDFIRFLAKRNGYLFYIEPGPETGVSRAVWGPPAAAIPQRALSVNLGSNSNVNSLKFNYDAWAPQRVLGGIIDRRTNLPIAVSMFAAERLPMSAEPALEFQGITVREGLVEDTAGNTIEMAEARALGRVSKSTDQVVGADGELDVMRYGSILKPFRTVGVRGGGLSYDGQYWVEKVVHKITLGQSYLQAFRLTREGVMELAPEVLP